MDNFNAAVLQEDRRHHTPEQLSLWKSLSVSQKFAATNLTGFGYDLTFIRNNDADIGDCTAILICGDNLATVNTDGDIDTNPDITIR